MTSLRSILAAGVLTILLAGIVFAGGFQLNEHGARAMAQGGAWAARAYDASAIYFNPAGLGFQKGLNIMAGATLIMPSASFFGPVQYNTNQETKMVSQVFTPINVYGTYAVTDDIVVGLGVYNPYGLGSEWPSDWVGKFITTKTDLQTFFITPTVAYKVNDRLSVGVGVSYVLGSAKVKRVLADPFDPHGAVSIEASGTGIGYDFGLLWKVTDDVSLGASYRSNVKVSPTGTATFTPNRAAYPGGDVETSIDLPPTGFIGLAYKATKNLELEFDYQYIGWKSYNELAFTFKKDGSITRSPKNYFDTYMLRAGAEYTMGDLQLRAGYLFDKNPVPDHSMEPLLPDADRNGVNIGAGYRLTENVTVDVSYLFLKFDERKAYGTDANFDGVYQSNANLFGFNVSYSF